MQAVYDRVAFIQISEYAKVKNMNTDKFSDSESEPVKAGTVKSNVSNDKTANKQMINGQASTRSGSRYAVW